MRRFLELIIPMLWRLVGEVTKTAELSRFHPVSGNDVIKVTLQSSSSTDARTLIVADSAGNQLTTMSAGTTASTQSYTYTGGGDAIWLYSQDRGIDILKIQVDSNGTSSTSTTTT